MNNTETSTATTTETETKPDSGFRVGNLDLSVRAGLAMILTLTVCYMHITGVEVKEPLYTLSTMAIGLYFGQKK